MGRVVRGSLVSVRQESVLNDKEIILTRDGLKKLEDELDELKTVHRREVNERIRQAKEFGDISENAEYEDAKQEQAFVEGRILKLESMIRNARIIDQSDFVADAVHLGATVKVKELARAARTSSRSSVRPKPIRRTRASRTSRRSAPRSWATRTAKPSTSRRRAAR